MAALAASLTGCGTSKCGWPMVRLQGFLRLRASSKTLRMPEDSMWRMRSAIQRSGRDGIRGVSSGGGLGGDRRVGDRRRFRLRVVVLEVVVTRPVEHLERLVDRLRPVAGAGLLHHAELLELVQRVADL